MSPRLPVRLLAVASLVPLLALASCLKKEDQAKLNKDGSGTLVQTTVIDKGLLEQFKGVVKMVGGGFSPGGAAMEGGAESGGDIELHIEDIFSPDDLKDRLKGKEGIELKKAEASDKDGKKSSRFEVAFASLEAVAKAGLFLEQSVDLKKNDDGSYTLTFDLGIQIPGVGAPAPAPAPGMDGAKPPSPLPGGMDMSGIFVMLEPIVGSFESKRTLVVPGTVVDTNGEKKDVEGGTSVTWTQVFKDFASGKKLTQSVTFKGEGLELKPFSYKPSFADMYKRYVKVVGGEDDGDGEGKEGKEGKEKPPTPVTPNK